MSAYLPIAILMTSLGVAPIILMMPEHASRLRTTVNLTAACVKLALVVWLTVVVVQGGSPDLRFSVAPGLDLHLKADALSVLFLALSAILWLITTVYAIGYLENGADRSRFFGFFMFVTL